MQYLVFWLLLMCFVLHISHALLPRPFKNPTHKVTMRRLSFKPDTTNVEDAITFAKTYITQLERFENTIRWPSHIDPGTPVHGSFLINEPDWKAIKRGRQAYLATKVSAQLAYTCCHEKGMTLDACIDTLNHANFYESSLNGSCSYLSKKCSEKESKNIYRSIDGTCNHPSKQSNGESYSAYNRLLDANYMNSFDIPKRSITKMPLPSPRTISTGLVTSLNDPHDLLTVAFTVFGEFLEHDMSSVATSVMMNLNHSFSCCDVSGFDIAPRYKHPFCMPISIPQDDPFYSKKRVECMSYARSLPAMKSDCSMGYMEQQNQATHYIDGSQIYGTHLEKSLDLRCMKKGKLNMSPNNLLPSASEPQSKCQVSSDNGVCFVSGDQRVNLHPQLTTMYTLWVREHNKIADELSKINPKWDDEKLYQESRRIVIAEMQHITYTEWLKNVVGDKFMNIITKNAGYNEDTDPSTANEFATGVIRFIDSMYSGNISLVNSDRTKVGVLRVPNHFNKPGVLTKTGVFDSIVRGITMEPARSVGINYAKEYINNYLTDENYGYDLLSIDIQRGRDHGLPSYTSYRLICGLPKATVFKDFEDVMTKESVEAVSKVYTHVDDVDLLVGGLLEKPADNSSLGPTFSCLVGEQFFRSKRGDRYFYTNFHQPHRFSESQLEEIKKISLARVFCDNSNIDRIQRRVFEKVSSSNPLTSCYCDNLPKLNLYHWKEE